MLEQLDFRAFFTEQAFSLIRLSHTAHGQNLRRLTISTFENHRLDDKSLDPAQRLLFASELSVIA